MERPRQHVLDSLGADQLRSIFDRLGWTVNKVEHDYGIDFEVEIFHEFKSTGASFKVQLKSSESTEYSADGNFVSQQIDRRNVRYLCEEVRAPVILVHADVKGARTFWLAPQLDLVALEALARRPDAESVTFRIPTANELPSTRDGLIEAVSSAEIVLASRVVTSSAVPNFVGAILGRLDEEEVVQELRIRANALRISRLQELFEAGELDEARMRIAKVLSDPESSVGSKFWTVLLAEKIEIKASSIAGRRSDRVPLQLNITANLQELTRGGPAHLKFYALIARKAAELDSLVSKDFGLYINWEANKQEGDPFWKLTLTFERTALAGRIVRKFNQCLRLAGYAAGYKHQWALPTALLRIVVASSVLILRVSSEGLEEASRRFVQSCMAICKLAARIAVNYHDDDALEDAATAAFFLTPAEGGEGRIWAFETLKEIGNPQKRCHAEDRLKQYIQVHEANEAQTANKQHFTVEETREVYENVARALGINLSDPRDRIADVVRIGLKDLDPSRVLRNCEHIYVSLSFHGLVADWLQLPTAGGKVVHCTLHKYAIEGLDLDGAYSFFKERYCDKCPDCLPRPSTWKYSMERQELENKRYEQFMMDFDRRTGRGGARD
jgi:hypothetical protein